MSSFNHSPFMSAGPTLFQSVPSIYQDHCSPRGPVQTSRGHDTDGEPAAVESEKTRSHPQLIFATCEKSSTAERARALRLERQSTISVTERCEVAQSLNLVFLARHSELPKFCPPRSIESLKVPCSIQRDQAHISSCVSSLQFGEDRNC